MNKTLPKVSLGIEEELFLVNEQTKLPCRKWPKAFLDACQVTYPNQIEKEFANSQVELITSPHFNVQDLHQELNDLRHFVSQKAKENQLAIMASSTHPEACWRKQTHTNSLRYDELDDKLQMPARRLLVNGMHIHVGIEGNMNQRLKLLNQLVPHLPLILSLTTSSPFWSGFSTGLASYRASVISELPRSGLPPCFQSVKCYEAYLKKLIDTQIIDNPRELWWDIRLSSRFPTVEIRIADTCTSTRDAAAVAAFIQCLAAYLLVHDKQSLKEIENNFLYAKENRWRAQRYLMKEAAFIGTENRQLHSVSSIIDQWVKALCSIAEKFNCRQNLLDCLAITEKGSSASMQLAIYQKALGENKTKAQALDLVIEYLLKETCSLPTANIDIKKISKLANGRL